MEAAKTRQRRERSRAVAFIVRVQDSRQALQQQPGGQQAAAGQAWEGEGSLCKGNGPAAVVQWPKGKEDREKLVFS